MNEEFINKVNHYDWNDGIPLDSLELAGKLCKEKPNLAGCDKIIFLLQDISNGYATCHDDQRSMLCQDVLKEINKHPIVKILPIGQSYSLPDSFWYWSLPTRILDSSADKYDYRTEAASWWWARNQVAILVVFFTLVALVVVRIYLSIKRSNAIAVDAELKRKESKIAEFEMNKKIIAEKVRDREREEAERVRQAAVANQKRLMAEKIIEAKKIADEAAAQKILEQKTKEKEEAERLLDAAFATPVKSGKKIIGQSSVPKRNQSANQHG